MQISQVLSLLTLTTQMCLTIRHCGLSPCKLQLTVLHIRVICIYKGNFMNVPIVCTRLLFLLLHKTLGMRVQKMMPQLHSQCVHANGKSLFFKTLQALMQNHHPRNIVTYLMWVRRQFWSDIEFLNYILISFYKKCSHTCNHNAFPPILVLARTDVLLKRISSPTVGPICTEFTHDNKMCSACSFVQKQISSS